MASLILLEDEPVLREELGEFLAGAGYDVDTAGTLAEFDLRFDPARHQIAIVDLGLPDGDGLDLVARLNAQARQLGVIVLTARSGVQDKLTGLAGGADHYLPKTTDLAELAATVAVLARRLGVQSAPCWTLHGSPRQLTSPNGQSITLSGQDHDVLLALAHGGTDGATRKAIVAALGGDFYQYDQRRLDTQMRRLRRKVEAACGVDLPVTTLRGIGYRFHDRIVVRR